MRSDTLGNSMTLAALDSLPVGIFVKGGDLLLVHANDKACSMVDRPRDKLVGRPMETFMSKSQAAYWEKIERQVLESGRQMSFEHEFDWRGARSNYEVNVSRLACEADNEKFVLITLNENSGRPVRSGLDNDENSYRKIIENAPVAFVRTTPDGKIRRCNAAAARLLGFDDENQALREVSNVSRQLYVDPKQRDGLLADLEGEGEALNRELHLKRRDGSRFWSSVSLRRVRDKKNDTYYDSFLFDISPIKAAENAAISASLAKSRFLAKISHEVRTPLSGLLGMLQLIQIGRLGASHEKFLSGAVSAGNNLLHVVNNILDISKIEAGIMRFKQAPFSLHETISTLNARYRPLAEIKGLGLETSIGPEVPGLLLGDDVKLCQILSNLLDNALKHTKSGLITLKAFCRTPSDAEGRIRIHFLVKDSGCGLSDRTRDRLLVQASDDPPDGEKNYRNSGLGLIIVKNFVERMGGTLSLSGSSKQGAEIGFNIETRLAHPETTLGQAGMK